MTDRGHDSDTNPREPEIELLGKLARGFLLAARGVFFLAGVTAIIYGSKRALIQGGGWEWPGFAWRAMPSASGAVWAALGLPLVLRADAVLNRGRTQFALIIASAMLWFGPILLQDDSAYGYILRLFATFVAFLCLAVWRTLWRLTGAGLPSQDADPTL